MVENKALTKQSKFEKRKDLLPPKTAGQVVSEIMNRPKREEKAPIDVQREKKRNANTIVAFFNDQYKLLIHGVPPLISGKEKKLAKDLIEHYGYDVVQKMFLWVLQNWKLMQREKRLDGMPNIGLIYGFRSYVQGKIESTVPKSDEAEADESEW